MIESFRVSDLGVPSKLDELWDEQLAISRSLNNPELFHNRYFSQPPYNWKYFNWYKELDKIEKRLKLILVQPGAGKTTRLHEEVVRRIVKNRGCRIGFFSKIQGRSRLYMEAVGNTLKDNKPLKRDFGEFYVPHNEQYPWNASMIRVKGSDLSIPTPTLVNIGVSGQVESLRFNMIVADDPIDIETTMSPADTQKMIDRLAVWIERLEPGGELWIIGHRFAPNDYYQHIIDDRKGFEVLTLKTVEYGRLLVPERWPTIEIFEEEITKNLKDWEFLTHYQQEPVAPGDCQFNWEWIEGGDRYQFIPRNRITGGTRIAVFDPAYTSGNKSDYSAGIIGQKFGKGIVITDIGDWKLSGGWSSVFSNFAVGGGARKAYVEINNAQTLGEEMKRYCGEHNLPVIVEGFKSKGKKEFRIGDTLEVMARQGRIYFAEELRETESFKRLKQQFILFPRSEHDDLLDVLEMVVYRLVTSGGRTINPIIRM